MRLITDEKIEEIWKLFKETDRELKESKGIIQILNDIRFKPKNFNEEVS